MPACADKTLPWLFIFLTIKMPLCCFQTVAENSVLDAEKTCVELSTVTLFLSVVCGHVTLASPRSMLERQNLRSLPSVTESQSVV